MVIDKNIALTSIVLMAGYSRRMGHLKQHVMLKDKTFLEHIIETIILFHLFIHFHKNIIFTKFSFKAFGFIIFINNISKYNI